VDRQSVDREVDQRHDLRVVPHREHHQLLPRQDRLALLLRAVVPDGLRHRTRGGGARRVGHPLAVDGGDPHHVRAAPDHLERRRGGGRAHRRSQEHQLSRTDQDAAPPDGV
jgi:hypothetical protein